MNNDDTNNDDTFRTYLLSLTAELQTRGLSWTGATDLIHDELEPCVTESWGYGIPVETCAATLLSTLVSAS